MRTLTSLERPIVIVDVFPQRRLNLLYFRIRNVGVTPAYGVRIAPSAPFMIRSQSSSDLNIFNRPVPVIAAGDAISFLFDTAAELSSRIEEYQPIRFKVEYEDIAGGNYKDTATIDITLLKGLELLTPSDERTLDKLAKLDRHIEEIAWQINGLCNTIAPAKPPI